MSTIVIMPGGFHPFHAGHAALYDSARKAFPGAQVFVAATNDTSNRPFPFAIKEKLAKLAGVEPGHFVQVKSPFRAEEITSQFDPAKDRLIFVRSEKDADKPPQAGGVKKDGSLAYLQPLAGQTHISPFGKHAYMAYLPTVEFGPGMTSATEIRGAWPTLNEKRKTALVMSLYPATQKNPKLAANVVKMLDTAMGGEELNEFVGNEKDFRGRPDIKARYQHGQDFVVSVNGDQYSFAVTNMEAQGENPVLFNIANHIMMDVNGDQPPRDIQQAVANYIDEYHQRDLAKVSAFHDKKYAQHPDYYHTTYQKPLQRVSDFVKKDPDQDLNEFAPGGGDDGNGPDEYEILHRLAAMWWLGTEQQMIKAEKTLAAMGWEIGEDEGYDDGGVFVVRAGDENGKSYISWPHEDLQLDENQGWAATFTNEETGQMAGTPASTGMWAGYQRRENQPIDEKKKKTFRDTELIKTQQFAQSHYPTYDAETAFDKWVQRSLKHSEQEDQQQDKILARLAAKVDMLNKKLNSLQKSDYIEEKWSQKYKNSINCANPKGFSQRAHCQGRKKK